MNDWLFALTLLAAIGSGLIGGVFFAFSSFVMPALARRPTHEAVAAMQAINITVINPAFMTLFLGTAVASVALLVAAGLRWAPGSGWIAIGSVLYALGSAGVTVGFNVPLNNALADAPPEPAAAADLWDRYLVAWTRWNHVRTVAAATASLAFMLALRGL